MSQGEPRNVKPGLMFVCHKRTGERIETLRCTACGWWGQPNDPADGGLFPLHPEHTDEECSRRQTDAWFRHEQDTARMTAAGLPAPPSPNPVPSQVPKGQS